MQSHGCLKQTCCTGAGLQMADITLGRAKTDAVGGCPAEDFAQALYFYYVAHTCAGAVCFNQSSCGRVETCIFPSNEVGTLSYST